MKKTYLARRNALLSAHGVSWGVGALLFALLVLSFRLIAPNLFWKAFTPVFRAADTFTAAGHTFLASFSDAAELAELNEQLASDNAALALRNQLLEEQLGTEGISQISGILASVVARPPTSPYDTLVLAAGTRDGVMLGMEAFDRVGVPIGIVSSVQQNFSRVTLFSSAGVTTDGWVGSASIPITLIGTGGGTFEASVARAANIAEGDMVYVPGPGQLPIGKVIRIDSDPLFHTDTLRISPTANLFSLSWVQLRTTGITGVRFATSTP